MSASEKLKALDAEWRSDEPFEVTRQEAVELALIEALPQIVAVVEAAQVQAILPGLCDDLRAALAALEEALT
jgi:hypothetical protein